MTDVSIIPAEIGTFVLYGQDNDLFHTGEPVIAWRIVTNLVGRQYRSESHPILARGEPDPDWVGILFPHGTVLLHDTGHPDMASARASYAQSEALLRK